MIVVGLIFIIMYVTLVVVVLAAGVVASAVEALLVFGRIVPGVVGLFGTVEGQELHHGVVGEIAALEEIGVEFCRGAVEITFRPDV